MFEIFQESLTWDGSNTEVGERGCNLQLVKLDKYSMQVLNSIKQYRIFWKILVKLEIFPKYGWKSKIFETTTYVFSAEIHLDISECEATKCKPCSPPSVPMQFHDKSMLFTIVLTFNASARACEKKDVKPCQTMSNPRAYNAICANI